MLCGQSQHSTLVACLGRWPGWLYAAISMQQRQPTHEIVGTHRKFDEAFTFVFEETPHGWVWAHAD